jgi:hypothetical protein
MGLNKRSLWVAAGLAPLAFAATARAACPTTTVGSATTAPISTNSCDITISSAGSIAAPTTSTAGTTAVTVNTPNSVTNSGDIGVSETTSYSDTNGDGIADTNSENGKATPGQYAVGGSRFGIQVVDGVQGVNIDNENAISVIGENSAGISIGSSGLSGNLTNAGTITITGGNINTSDVSYGILATGTIVGNVSLTGSVTATGQNAQAVSLGPIGGALVVSSALTATGYRDTTAPTYVGYLGVIYNTTTKAQTAASIAASQGELLQGGPGLNIGGSVGGGINVTAATAATSTVAAVAQGSVISYGSAPAVLIGGSNAINIGAVSGSTYGLVIGGVVTGAGTYRGFNGVGMQIGGTNPLSVSDNGAAAATLPSLDDNAGGVAGGQFGAVTVAGGIDISGTLKGSAVTADMVSGGVQLYGSNSAVGLHIGAGATVPSINVEAVQTTVDKTTTTTAGLLTAVVQSNSPLTSGATLPSATALQIDTGASVSSIVNSGTISAVIEGDTTTQLNGASNTAGGDRGVATAIKDSDASGGALSITNKRTISATFTPPEGTAVQAAPLAVATAMDLRGTTGAVTVTQNLNANSTTAAPIEPSIVGDILFGSGVSTLNLNAGTITGAVAYGAGGGSLTIDGVGVANGSSNLGDNGFPVLTGAITTSGGPLAIALTNGTLNDRSTSTITGSTLQINKGGVIVFDADPLHGVAGGMTVSGAANLASGAQIGLNFISKLTQATSYTVIATTGGGTLTTAGNIDPSLSGLFPYMYAATATQTGTNGGSGSLVLNVSIKSPAAMGLNAAEASAFNAVYQAFSNDTAVEAALLSKTDKAGFKQLYDQFLPNYAGGPFEALVTGQEALQRTQAEAPARLPNDEGHGWVEEIGVVDHHDNNNGGGYDGRGFGMIGGVENPHGHSAVGVSIAFLTTNVDNSGQTKYGNLASTAIEAGVYWRTAIGGLAMHAAVNGGWNFVDSKRLVYDASQSPVVDREATAKWSGGLASADIGASYQFDMGRFYMRPEVDADYVMLSEGGYSEKGGASPVAGEGDAVDLTVRSRLDKQASVVADVVFGANFGATVIYRPELTLGWREVITGGPANTTAYFTHGGTNGAAGGTFTLSPDFNDKGGMLARLGFRASGNYADFSADAGGEFRNGYQTYNARAVARFLF